MRKAVLREIALEEVDLALELSLRVFLECGFADYDADGVKLYRKFIADKDLVNALTIYGAFIDGMLIGLIGTRDSNSHISLFFIEKEYQGYGIGRRLFEFIRKESNPTHITVSSSTYAVDIYKKLGFIQLGPPETRRGLTSVSMEFRS